MKKYAFLLISCLCLSHADNRQASEICFVGATPNFFKAGHTAIRDIANRFPNAHIRLGLISEVASCPDIVKDLNSTGRLSYHTWPLGKKDFVYSSIAKDLVSAEMDGLINFFHGCTAAFLVPPIEDRVKIGGKYAEAVAIAKVPYAVVLGVQYDQDVHSQEFHEAPPKIAKHANKLYQEMDKVFNKYKSPIKYIVLNLPMFLENILYQAERIKNSHIFMWPIKKDSKFAYVSCYDLGKIVSDFLVNFEFNIEKQKDFIENKTKRRYEIKIMAGITSPAQLEKHFKKYVSNDIEFQSQNRKAFIEELKKYLHKSNNAAETIAELYDQINKGHDMSSKHNIFVKMGYSDPQSAQEWVRQHSGCFSFRGECQYPLPPEAHSPL